MKKFISTLLLVALSGTVAMAEIKFPKGTFEFSKIKEATEAATKEKKPIAYVYTDKKTTCGLASGATEAFIDAVGKKCVLVYLSIDESFAQTLGAEATAALRKGEYYPKLLIYSPAQKKVVLSVTYEEYKADDKKTVRNIKKALKDHKEG